MVSGLFLATVFADQVDGVIGKLSAGLMLIGPANPPRPAAWQHGGVIDIAEQDRVK